MLLEIKKRTEFNKILEELAFVLDITPTQHEDAVKRYEAVGVWLSQEGSPMQKYKPMIFPYGSFALGTVVKPNVDEDTYDIDLVCQLGSTKKHHTQQQIKNIVGDRLKDESSRYKDMLDDECQMSWTINYAEATKFHMDILPAIPDEYQWQQRLMSESVESSIAETAMCITDNKADDYEKMSESWRKSNPKGYTAWFKEQMKVMLLESRRLFSERYKMSIEQVQDYKVKTPLQRAVQLLKRHRDRMFKDEDDKPLSIIITTLAAKAYSNEDNIYDALINIFDAMPKYIETRYPKGKRVLWVQNPVNPSENFADTWENNPHREKDFFKWLQSAKQEITAAIKESNLHQIAEKLKSPFGERVINEAVNRMGNTLRETRENGDLYMSSSTGILGKTGSTKVQKHNFYGSEK